MVIRKYFFSLNPLKSGLSCNKKEFVLMSENEFVSIPLNRVFHVTAVSMVCFSVWKVSIPLNRVFHVTQQTQPIITIWRGLNPLKSGLSCNIASSEKKNHDRSLNPLKSGLSCNSFEKATIIPDVELSQSP